MIVAVPQIEGRQPVFSHWVLLRTLWRSMCFDNDEEDNYAER